MDILAILGFVIYVLFKVTGNIGRGGGADEERPPVPRPRKYTPKQDTWDDDTWNDDPDWKQVARAKPKAAETGAAPAGTKAATQRASIMPSRGEIMRHKQVGPVIADQGGTAEQNRDYGETPVPVSVPAAAEEQPNPWLKLLTGDNLVQGIVLSEILQPPRALRPFSTGRRR